jgi:hypothetical protein
MTRKATDTALPPAIKMETNTITATVTVMDTDMIMIARLVVNR